MLQKITGKNESGLGGSISISDMPATIEEIKATLEGANANGQAYLYDLAIKRFVVDVQGKLRLQKLFELDKTYTFAEVLEKLITNTRTPSVKAAITAQESIIATAKAVLVVLETLPKAAVQEQVAEQEAIIKSANITLKELRLKQADLQAIAEAKKKAKADNPGKDVSVND